MSLCRYIFIVLLAVLVSTAALFAQVPSAFSPQLERSGRIYAIAGQTYGRVLIGGDFDYVDGVPRKNIARLNGDGSLDMNWNPSADYPVYALAASGTNIYVGGQFQNIGGAARSRIAKLNDNTGAALPNVWLTGANGTVYDIVVSGVDVYVGGDFTSIQGQNRDHIAKLDPKGAVFFFFTNGANGVVRDLHYNGDFYAAGEFTEFGGLTRYYLAKFHHYDGTTLSWDPQPNNAVYSLSSSGSDIFAGGFFTRVGSTWINYAAKISGSSGAVDASWDPELEGAGYVDAIGSDLFNVYISGVFTQVDGVAKSDFAKVDQTTALLDTSWTNDPDDEVDTIYGVVTSNIYIGGRFSRLGSELAQSIARLTPANGLPDPDFPASVGDPGYVYCIATQTDGRVILAGTFDSVMGQDYPNLVRFMPDGTLDSTWAPKPDSSVNQVFPHSSGIYAAGAFRRIGGGDIGKVAKLDTTTGQLLPSWTNRTYGIFNGGAIDDTHLYVGGSITNIAGTTCRYLARFAHADNGLDTSWLPDVDNAVRSMDLDDEHLYVGGYFDTIGGQPLTNLARFILSTGAVDPSWDPAPNGSIAALVVDTSAVYAAGPFSYIGGIWLPNLARLSKTGGGSVDAGWFPDPNGAVYAILPQSDCVYIGGAFGQIGGVEYPYVAKVDKSNGDADGSWMPRPELDVRALCIRDGAIGAGGLFGKIGGMYRPSFAWLDPFQLSPLALSNGSPVVTWRSGSNGSFMVQYATNALGPYHLVVKGLAATPEVNTYIDTARSNYPTVFYRVFMQ